MEERTILEAEMPAQPAGEATQVIGGPGLPAGAGYGEATQHAITVTCPVCATPNGPGERFCQDCGLLFGSQGESVEPPPDASQLPHLVDSETGREFSLNSGVNEVGRESGEILLPHPTVSRRHAQITLEGGKLAVEDLGSSNGTFVGGRRLGPGERVEAFHGDTLKVGSVLLTVTLPGGQARSAQPEADAPAPPAPAAEDRGAPVALLLLPGGIECRLYAGTNSVGRRSTNQVSIADAFMSGKHAEIHCRADGSADLVDVGSTNGSFFAGARLAPHAPVALSDGMEFTLGKTVVTYRAAAAPSDEAPPEPADAAPEPADAAEGPAAPE